MNLENNIQLKNISRNFGNKTIIDNFSFNFQHGQLTTIQGPNGSGKTTLLKLIAGLLQLSSGSISLCGLDVSKDFKNAKNLVSWASTTDKGFFERLTGLDNLKLFATFYKIDQIQFDKQLRSLPEIGILDKALNTPYYLCSSGMKRILHLTRAIIQNRPVLLLDEPLNNLDSKTKNDLIRFLKNYKSDKITIIATHNLLEFAPLSDNSIILE